MTSNQALVVNGWSIFVHPLFMNEYEDLIKSVENLKKKDPENYKNKNVTKRLAAINKLAFEVIPKDPTLPEYRQGNTLGKEHKHWYRAKFFQQYRLFFRYHAESKIIVYAWVNNEKTKRAYDSKTDAYKTFEKMLNKDNPPDDWEALMKETKKLSSYLSEPLD